MAVQALEEQGFGVPDEEAQDWYFGDGTESSLITWQVQQATCTCSLLATCGYCWTCTAITGQAIVTRQLFM